MVVSKQHKLAHIVRNTTSLLSSADGKEEAKLPTSLIKTEIKVNRFRAHDSLKIVCKVREELTKGSGMNTCGMCFDDVHVSKIGALLEHYKIHLILYLEWTKFNRVDQI